MEINNKIELENNEKGKSFKTGSYGVRHTIAVIMFFAYFITYAMRTCLSVTIVVMVGNLSTGISSINVSNSTLDFNTSSDGYVSEIEWDEKTRGLVRGSFFYGHVMTYCLGGIVADYWGGRFPFGVSVILSSFLTIFSPYAAKTSSTLLICVRMMHGLVEGLGYGSLSRIIAQWYPIQERSKFAAYIYSGYTFGILVSMAVSGWLCTTTIFEGWPSAFYLFGSIGLSFSVFWFIFVFENPYKHPRIKRNELKYITQGLPEIKNGLISAIPFLGSSIISIAVGYIITYFSSRNYISLLSVRRISSFISGYLPMIGFLILVIVDSNSYLKLILFMIMESFLGAAACSIYCSPADLAPRFAGTVFGFSYTFGIIPGFLAPTVTGLLLQYFDTRLAWKIVFLLAASLAGIVTTIYIIFMSTEIQPWNEVETKKSKKDSQYKPCSDIDMEDTVQS